MSMGNEKPICSFGESAYVKSSEPIRASSNLEEFKILTIRRSRGGEKSRNQSATRSRSATKGASIGTWGSPAGKTSGMSLEQGSVYEAPSQTRCRARGIGHRGGCHGCGEDLLSCHPSQGRKIERDARMREGQSKLTEQQRTKNQETSSNGSALLTGSGRMADPQTLSLPHTHHQRTRRPKSLWGGTSRTALRIPPMTGR